MELMEAIFQRRAVRSYTDQPVSKTTIMELLQAAIQAPSAVNQQPWAFAVIRGRKRLDEYSERAKQHMLAALPQSLALHRRSDQLTNTNYHVFHHAGTVIVIYGKPAQFAANEDCCMAAQNLLLAAHGMGLGTCPIGFVRPWLDLPAIKSEMGVPGNYSAIMPIVVGWPAGKTAPTSRTEPEIVAWQESDTETKTDAEPLLEQPTPSPCEGSQPPIIGNPPGW
jgi:nitroreductase